MEWHYGQAVSRIEVEVEVEEDDSPLPWTRLNPYLLLLSTFDGIAILSFPPTLLSLNKLNVTPLHSYLLDSLKIT